MQVSTKDDPENNRVTSDVTITNIYDDLHVQDMSNMSEASFVTLICADMNAKRKLHCTKVLRSEKKHQQNNTSSLLQVLYPFFYDDVSLLVIGFLVGTIVWRIDDIYYYERLFLDMTYESFLDDDGGMWKLKLDCQVQCFPYLVKRVLSLIQNWALIKQIKQFGSGIHAVLFLNNDVRFFVSDGQHGLILKQVKQLVSTDLKLCAHLHNDTVQIVKRSPCGGLLSRNFFKDVLQIKSNRTKIAVVQQQKITIYRLHDVDKLELSIVRQEIYNCDLLVSLCSTEYSFGAIFSDGRVALWGNFASCNHITGVVDPFFAYGAVKLISTQTAFTILFKNGTAQTFVESTYVIINENFLVETKDDPIDVICCTIGAFAALLRSGKIITWGEQHYVSHFRALPMYRKTMGEVVSLTAKYSHFEACLKSGTIYKWGSVRDMFPMVLTGYE
jgi:hypothetical protein